jgi:hypothetical protein
MKWTHTVETVSAECLSSHFIFLIRQITIKFSICVCCKCCHVNFIWVIVSQVWPLLHTKPYFKLNDVLIWSSLFMAMDIYIVVFLCYEVACGQVCRRKSQERPPLCVCEHGDLLHFEFTSASVSSLNIVTPPPCFIKLQLLLFPCGNYAISFDKAEHLDVMLGRTQISVSTVWMSSVFRALWPKWPPVSLDGGVLFAGIFEINFNRW